MNMAIDRLLPWTLFPAVLLLAVALHVAMARAGVSLQVATYLPVLLVAGLVTLCELRLPHRSRWRPGASDVKDDLLFMSVVQLALPFVVTIAFTFAIIAPVRSLDLPVAALWPHSLPIPVQVVVMIVRSAHSFGLLWRLHQVHHSPEKLYWLNVGRFHPIEKVLQMIVYTLPFLLMGVAEQVVAAYFVVYAVNGFFKHSNIRLRFGPLNYLFSTAELHRWHHSRIPEESNRNYGNVTILWDLLFGTWYLPERRQITDIGIRDRSFPRNFLGQLLEPLGPRVVAGARRARRRLRWLTIRAVMALYGLCYWLPLRRAALRPRETQARVLRRILERNRETSFGRRHGFERIASFEGYTLGVPICTYEHLRPLVERQDATGEPALTSDDPIMYASTSGTTGKPKFIPVLTSTIRDCVKDQRLFSYLQYRSCPEAFAGKVLAIGSPAVEGLLASGRPYGSLSGHIYECMPKLVKSNYVVPAEVFAIEDYDLKYEIILRLALGEPDITLMAAANPSSFLRLRALLNDRADVMTESLATGELAVLDALPAHIQDAVRPRLRPAPARAEALRRASTARRADFADLWPGIRLLTTWTSGSCGIALETLRESLPRDALILDLGYLSSEFRGTVTFDARSIGGIPTIHRHFFEFVERDAWDRGERRTLLVDELETGSEYYVLVTTGSGLYRYFMNDIVRVTGHFRQTPIIEFVQKGRGVTSITGEKLYEGQVAEAVRRTEKALRFTSVFYVMLAEEELGRYALYLEPHGLGPERAADIAEGVDIELGRLNIEYRAKRASSRLAPLDVRLLMDGSADDFKRFHLTRGQREGQFKPVTLQYRSELQFPLDRYRLGVDAGGAYAH